MESPRFNEEISQPAKHMEVKRKIEIMLAYKNKDSEMTNQLR